MAVRGGKSKRSGRAERKQLALPMPAEELAAVLNPLIYRELATIGAIDTVAPRERNAGYVVLMRATKLGKQASIEQMASMIRLAGGQPVESAAAAEAILKLQSALARRLGTTPVLRAMRLAEADLVHAYGEVIDRFDGMFRKGLEKCWHRAIKHLTVLTAHIAVRSAKPEVEEMLALPLPLDRYFANGEDRVCFRCLFDRRGKLGPIERSDPHPYTYLCGACHEEVLCDFPADLVESMGRWSDREREGHVLERSMGRPSKLKAEMLVLTKMSGLAPDMPPPPMPRKVAHDASPKRRAPAQPRPRVELGGIADASIEQAYSDSVFDYETVRGSW
jgi:hypothetical protein